jgi:aspartyl-tRNA(Asn)/glutamyl-tRNA(Gln) amidotransferase subunit B
MERAHAAVPETDGELEMVIGLEVHCQLRTRSKIFCACATTFGAAPNSATCPVCLGLPGALPVLNAEAVALAVRAALALGCTVHDRSEFARKHYFYPDLPKGYQISQFDAPLATGGGVDVSADYDGSRIVRLHRIHMEEDAGKSIHDRFAGFTAVDLNRTGTPLIEIVSEPDLRSAADAAVYVRRLKQLLEYTEVSDANMEEGSLRVDVNVSIRTRGSTSLGVKREIKNLNTISGVERAIGVEFAQQRAMLGRGERIVQQTLLWDGARQALRTAREKEGSEDYRYFADPDLPPLRVFAATRARENAALPELPAARTARLKVHGGLSWTEAEQLTVERTFADFYEAVVGACREPKRAANWMLGVVLASWNARGVRADGAPVGAAHVAALITMEAAGELSNAAAKQLYAKLESEPGDPRTLAQAVGLLQVRDDDAIAAWVDAELEASRSEADRWFAGETKLLGVLVGRIMKRSGGAADPRRVNLLLTERLRQRTVGNVANNGGSSDAE